MTSAYILGIACNKLGHSIYYNPFEHKGSSQEYLDWISGWKSVKV